LFGHNSPAAAAREVFKPSTDSARLLVSSQKNFSVLGLGFSWGDVTSGGVLAFYGLLYPDLDAKRMAQHFGPSIFLETRLSYEFLEPLFGFLAYLDKKLCHENQNMVTISTPKICNQGGITSLLYMAITRR